jgi:uncharacterized protein YecT (DUF1311 family)
MKNVGDTVKFTIVFMFCLAGIVYFGPAVLNSIESKIVSGLKNSAGSLKNRSAEVGNTLGSTVDESSPKPNPGLTFKDPVVAAEAVPAQARASQDPPLTSSASLPASQTVLPPQPRDPLLDVLKDSEKTAAVKKYEASFDCRKATIKAEKLICENRILIKYDLEIHNIYKSLLDNQPFNVDFIRKTQRSWIANDRNACETVQCLEGVMKDRIIRLNNLDERPKPLS